MVISTDMFFWDAKLKEFRQEISTLKANTQVKTLGFWNGVTLKNPKTGGMEHFIFENKIYDREGDLTSWRFSSENIDLDLKLIIWND